MPFQKNTLIYFSLTLIAIALFVIWRWADIGLPYYWDELGVYAPSALYLLDNGISMMPSALDPEFSRGHPMLCAFLYSCWMKIFGVKLTTVHLFSLIISLSTVLVTFLFGKEKNNARTGFWAASLLLVQPVFMAQSMMVLPEMMLAFFLILAVYFAHKKWWIAYFMSAALAILTKETGIVLPVALMASTVLMSFGEKREFNLVKRLSIFGAPLLVFVLFLIVQRIQNGWFLFPYHTDLMSFAPIEIWARFKQLMVFLFWKQGRFIWPILLMFHWLNFQHKKQKKEDDTVETTFTMGLGLSFGPFSLYLLGFVAFFALNFLTERYTLLFFPILCILLAEILERIGTAAWGIWGILLFLAFTNMNQVDFSYDYDMNYKKVIAIQQETTQFMDAQNWEEEKMYVAFPIYMCLYDTRMGYTNKEYSNFIGHYTDSCQIVVSCKPGSYSNRFNQSLDQFDVMWKKNGLLNTTIYSKIIDDG